MTGSAGERAGLCEWDVVVEVNGQNVEEEYFDEVVRLIKEGGTPLRLLVVEGEGYQKLRNTMQTSGLETSQTSSSGLNLRSNTVRHTNTHARIL